MDDTEPSLNLAILEVDDAAAADNTLSVRLAAGKKLAWCGWPGRDDVKATIDATAAIYSSMATREMVRSCVSEKPKNCLSFDDAFSDKANTDGGKVSVFGEVANRERCVFLYNIYAKKDVNISVSVKTKPHNWQAIGFAIAASTITLASIVTIGCRRDVSELRRKHSARPKSSGGAKSGGHSADEHRP